VVRDAQTPGADDISERERKIASITVALQYFTILNSTRHIARKIA